MVTTIFKSGTDLAVGDVVHPAEGEPSRVVDVQSHDRRALVTLANGTVADLTADDVVEVESVDVLADTDPPLPGEDCLRLATRGAYSRQERP